MKYLFYTVTYLPLNCIKKENWVQWWKLGLLLLWFRKPALKPKVGWGLLNNLGLEPKLEIKVRQH